MLFAAYLSSVPWKQKGPFSKVLSHRAEVAMVLNPLISISYLPFRFLYNRMGYWSDWSIPILVTTAAGFTYITVLLVSITEM